MFYYLVWVRSIQYRGQQALTYRYTAQLAVGAIVAVPLRNQQVLGLIVATSRKPRFATKAIVVAYDLPPLPANSLKLGSWLQSFYPSPLGVITSQFVPKALHMRYLQELPAIHQSKSEQRSTPPPLTGEQAAALRVIQAPDTYVLHGRTGSGKTRLYIELATRTLEDGRSVLVLSPEIGLTSQLAARFREAFSARVIVLHSQLTAKEREIVWLTILHASEPIVVVGPRSALFSPLRSIGLIIIDESHDPAYKQEQAPYYQSLRVASELRTLHNAILVLGSATPTITDYYVALRKSKPIIRLDALAVNNPFQRSVTIVNLKDTEEFSRSPHLSLRLIEAVAAGLERHEQAMLYLNRRGTARVAFCEVCGWQALCPHCDLPLVYHGDSHTLRCHTCGYTIAALTSCPSCGNASLAFHTFGTKAVVDEARRLFPGARIRRFDTDNQKSERLEAQYESLANGDVDIIIGTQMIAKGLDLPHLSTLGIVLADASLYLPDYTTAERTYQLLNQVAGRVGRGHLASHIIVQTYNPTNPLILAALDDKWSDFYNQEIVERQKYFFPPFSYLLKLSTARKSSKAAEAAAAKLKQQLETKQYAAQIDGPAPAFRERAAGLFVWQLVVRTRKRSILLEIIDELPANWSYDIDPSDLM